MSSFRLASRYAKSLLQLSKEKGSLEAVKSDMDLIYATLTSSKEFRVFLKSPIIHADKKLGVIRKVFSDKLNPITNTFVELLTKKGREAFLLEVASAFNEQYNTLNHITKVKITSATELDAATIDKILASLKVREKLDNMVLETKVDESLIAGFVLNYDGKELDTSVRSSLTKLQVLVDDDSYVKKIR